LMLGSGYFGKHSSIGNNLRRSGKLNSIKMFQTSNSNSRKRKSKLLSFTILSCTTRFWLMCSKLIHLKMLSKTMPRYISRPLRISINWVSWTNRLKLRNFGMVLTSLIQMCFLFKNSQLSF
jgi:hypothetical protein